MLWGRSLVVALLAVGALAVPAVADVTTPGDPGDPGVPGVTQAPDPTAGDPTSPDPTPSDPPGPSGPLRLLITGDSITQGFHGDYTWRYWLDKELDRQGVAVDLVGSQTRPYSADPLHPASYADPRFDQDHFAFAGTTLLQQSDWIGPEITTEQPDLVVLASGVNDLRHGGTPQETLDHFELWLEAARAADPGIDVIVSPPLDATDVRRPNLRSDIATYDALLSAALPNLSTPASTLTLADTGFGWDVVVDTCENLHPSPTGETHIAQRIAETLQLLGKLPQAPQIEHVEAWNRSSPVAVHLTGRTASLTWDDQMVSGAKLYRRQAGTAGVISHGLYRQGTAGLTGLKYGATYEFRVQLTRGRMVGPWGPVTRIKVPVPPPPPPVARVVVSRAGVRWTPSRAATSYRVRTMQVGSSRWVTRTTASTYVLLRNVRHATVSAVNVGGASVARAAR